jgi:hypothetical protein
VDTYGSKHLLTATVAQTGGEVAKAAGVSLQFRAAGSTTWTTLATATTNSAGTAKFTTTATRNGSWRVVTAAKSLTWAGSTSNTLTVSVRSTLTVKQPVTRTTHGKTVTYTAGSLPYVSGTKLQFQLRRSDGTWATLVSSPLAANGTATAKITFTRTGSATLRIYRPATANLAAAYSPSWTVHVS